MNPPSLITLSNIIIDDIVLWDGRTLMATPGGAGTHALVGMRVWVNPDEPLGIGAWVGPDFDADQRKVMTQLAADLGGLLTRADPSARAWQIIEQDDRRHEIFRTDLGVFARNMPNPLELPARYWAARGMHLMGNNSVLEFSETVAAIKRLAPQAVLVAEPSPEQVSAPLVAYQHLLPNLSVFSPDIDHARRLTGQSDPHAIVQALLDAGAPSVALRMGAQGSLVCERSGAAWHIPAVPPKAIVDVTGAGNAYCGGMTVALAGGLPIVEASLRAAVSASFALEQFGPPHIDAAQPHERDRRMAWARAHARMA